MGDRTELSQVSSFEAVMERKNRPRGFFLAFGYSSDAEHEAAAFNKRPD